MTQELKDKAKAFLTEQLNLKPTDSTPYAIYYNRVVQLLCDFYELSEKENACVCEQNITVTVEPIEKYILKAKRDE